MEEQKSGEVKMKKKEHGKNKSTLIVIVNEVSTLIKKKTLSD